MSNSRLFAKENGAYLAMTLCGFLVYVIGYNLYRMLRPPKTTDEPGKEPPALRAVVGRDRHHLVALLRGRVHDGAAGPY